MGLLEFGIARGGIFMVQRIADIETREEGEEADQQDKSEAAHELPSASLGVQRTIV
jgi:hypothetical protein